MQAGEQSGTNRIYDEEGGLGVEWVRDEPPMERATHFRLVLPDLSRDFIASYEFSIGLLMRERPELSASEASRLAGSDHRVQFQASNIGGDFDRDKFVEVWHKLLANRNPELAVHVIYSEFRPGISGSHSEWRKSS